MDECVINYIVFNFSSANYIILLTQVDALRYGASLLMQNETSTRNGLGVCSRGGVILTLVSED